MSTQNDPAVNQPKVAQSATGEDQTTTGSGQPLEPIGSPPPPAHAPVADRAAPPFAWVAWLLFALLIVGAMGVAMYQSMQKHKLGPELPVMGTVPPFELIDENGQTVGLDNFKGQPWVIDWIFTRCGGQCPLMTQRMAVLQGWLKEKGIDNVKLVSGTVDPENDSPEVMKSYATAWKADPAIWTFLTGEREAIYPLITEGFKLGVEENEGKPVSDMFVHSDRFVLVDAEGQIRGYFVLSEDAEMRRMQSAIRRLLNETRTGSTAEQASTNSTAGSAASASAPIAPTSPSEG